MKKLLFVLFITTFCVNLFAQDSTSVSEDWDLNSVSLSTGESSLTKGLTLSAEVSKGDYSIVVDFNNDLGEVLAFQKLSDNVSTGLTFGFYKNVLWWAPIFTTSFFDGHLKTLHWAGYSFGDSEKKENKLQQTFMFSYQQISICFFDTDLSYAFQNYYQLKPEHIFSIKKVFNLNENFSMSGSAGYMKHANEPLWSIGLTYKFE